MGFCETCTVPRELAKLDVEGNYQKLLADPEVCRSLKDLYMALGQLGTCETQKPEIDEIYDGQITLHCKHEQADMSKGNYALQDLSNSFGDIEDSTSFVPTYFSGTFEELAEPTKYEVAQIICDENIPAASHGIDEEHITAYYPVD